MQDLPSLSATVKRHGLFARKSLGQHFLLDEHLTANITRLTGPLNGLHITEVGPGPGGLTRALLQSGAAHIYAVEKDARCARILGELAQHYPGRLTLFLEDALKFSAAGRTPAPRAVIANLPYNIGTALLLHWLDDIAADTGAYRFLTLMFQKEVAERLFAEPGSKAYGRLSVITQWLFRVEHGFDLPAGAFTPPPKVDSSVVILKPLPAPRYPADKETLQAVVAAAFGQRRKMLRSSLSTLSSDTVSWLAAAGIDPTRRAETLAIEEFCRLAQTMPRG